jgi:predicted ArsR family transcriptional regulator
MSNDTPVGQGARQPDAVAAIALLDEPKRRALYEFVTSRREPVGRDEAARELGIGRELAAFHLDRLAAAGLLEVEYRRLGERRGPGAGRPAKLYRRSAAEVAVSLPARDYERLAEMLADAIERADEGAGSPARGAGAGSAELAADAAAHERGVGEGMQARAKVGRRPGRGQLRAGLIELLGEDGYAPTTTPDGTVRLQNCPYHALSATHRDLTCGMNLAWAEGVLDGLDGAGLEATLAPEPGYCCVRFEESREGSQRT